MKNEPELTIELLLRNFKTNLDPNKIISAIMSTELKKREKVVDYLEDLIKNYKIEDKNIHNLFIFFLSQINTEKTNKKIMNYLHTLGQKKQTKKYIKKQELIVFFDIDYAFNVFSQFKIFSAQAYTLFIMGKFDEAIKVSLQNNCVKLAKEIATKVEDPKIKKILWIEVCVITLKNRS